MSSHADTIREQAHALYLQTAESLANDALSAPEVSPHEFRRRGWRWWICTNCYGPRRLHPRTAWSRARPVGDNTYLSPSAPHFKEGW